jgi:hypothetical protein
LVEGVGQLSALLIAGIVVNVSTQGAAQCAAERIGSTSRTYNGGLRSTVRAEKRVWNFTTTLMLSADVATLLAAVALGAHVVCSGDALRATVTCEVEIGDQPYIPVAGSDALGYMRQVQLTLREV